MKEVQQSSSRYHVCKPLTPEHRRGVRWFSSLAQHFEHAIGNVRSSGTAMRVAQSLQHSIQFYGTFAETGDQRYLSMCEDFLKYTIKHARA
jgi:hypothetical protein